MTGKTLGKYRIVDKLGRGGMGTVYRAVDETLEREVAVKVLNPGLAEPAIMQRFQAEAVTLARLNHPDIATIHEIYQSDGDLLMVMELVRGETLDELLQRCGVLPAERAAYLVAQILGALDHAHREGIIHRDLKPANVMVTEYGGIKIMDFGIAHVAGAEHITAAGFMMGTPAYMAPERVLGQNVDARSDLYSVGVLFYRLVTGCLPYKAGTPAEMAQRVLSDEPTPARVHRPDLPGWCQAILDRALAKSPADRFQNAEVFRATLVSAISGVGSEETGLFATPDPATTQIPDLMTATDLSSSAVDQTASTAPLPPGAVPMTGPPAIPMTGSGPSVVLEKKQFAIAGGLVGLLFLAVVVLAVLVLRRPTVIRIPTSVESSESASPLVAAAPAGAPSAAPATSANPSVASPAAAPVEIVDPPIRPVVADAPPAAMPVPAGSPKRPDIAPAAPVRTVPVAPSFSFEAKAVVADGGKRRERDADVVLADGTMTVSGKDKGPLYVVPLNTVTGLTYSNSRQPLWNSPAGPAEAMRVEGGAFGFIKGGGRNWFGVRTAEALLVLRVEDSQVAPVISALQDRTGLTLQRLVEPKD